MYKKRKFFGKYERNALSLFSKFRRKEQEMTSVELEMGKMELIREIMNINNSITLENLKACIKDFLRADSAVKHDTLTERMIKKYAGGWKDSRSSDEVIDDIYSARLSHHQVNLVSPFDA